MLDRYFGLDGKVALITGATRGIGAAMADAFAGAGARLVIAGDEAAACEEGAARLREAGAEAVGIGCDVRDAAQLKSLADRAHERFDRVDVLVCNAGISPYMGPIGEAGDAVYEAVFDVNLRHALRLAGLIAPGMAERRDGSIVVTSSIAGLRDNKEVGLYGLSKAALAALARNLAVEWGPYNVRANAISPGLVATSWAQEILSDPEATRRRMRMTPLRRVAEPWEVAAAALYLASPAGAFITGHNLVIDGGTTITDGSRWGRQGPGRSTRRRAAARTAAASAPGRRIGPANRCYPNKPFPTRPLGP